MIMECDKRYTIKVTGGNDFQLLLRLKTRNYVSSKHIDEDIDPRDLQNIVIKVGHQTWTDYTIDADGVIINIPADMGLGTYNVMLSATYHDVAICAAYYECFTLVPWSYQADAENYIPSSPVASEVAYIIGITGDAELEELKEEYRQKTADAEAAETAAEAAKENFDSKAESLADTIASQQQTIENLSEGGGGGGGTAEILAAIDAQTAEIKGTNDEATNSAIKSVVDGIADKVDGIEHDVMYEVARFMAKQGTDATATNTAILAAIGNITIDTSGLAKQGSNASATNTAILAAIPSVASIQSGLATSANVSGAASGLQGTDNTATLTAIQQLIGYTINEIDNV
jgi:hypothetical protein